MAQSAQPRRLPPKLLLLLPPYIALCFPQIYDRATPEIFGFPFFYWYQFLWVILTSTLLGIYHRISRTPA